MKPVASIIIASYNNFAVTTAPCLESLLSDPLNKANEIIVVDNASSDGTPEKLRLIAATTSNMHLILNQINRGFAGGNNDGVAAAQSDIVILLNSDTIVPAGAMTNLARLLADNPDWAMIGPVTNAAGNEQQIFTSSQTPAGILKEGEEWCVHSRGFHFPSERLDFFCVAICKDVYRELGGLDENFGLGYYEDTAFSIKARRAGKKMMTTEDVFVYHQGGKSFSTMEGRKKRKMMRENQKKLFKNYGRDVPLHRLRDRNLAVLEEYIIQKKHLPKNSLADLDFKFTNRLQFAQTLYPNNPFKKISYWLSLRAVCRKYGASS